MASKKGRIGTRFSDFLDERGVRGEVEGPADEEQIGVDKAAFHDRLAAHRLRPKGPPITSVELLDQIYVDPATED